MLLFIVLILFWGVVPAHAGSQIDHVWGKIDLAFEANQGQTDPEVKFLSRGGRYSLFLTADEAVLRFTSPKPAVVRMKLAGRQRSGRIEGIDPLIGATHYLVGATGRFPRTNVPSYKKVRYFDVYPGIDVVYYGNQRLLEHDFIVKPGADPSEIRVAFEGIHEMALDKNGDLLLKSDADDIYLKKPRVYQDIGGVKKDVQASYVINGDKIGFRIGDYDKTKPLIIDPVLVYSTYFGGAVSGTTGDLGNAITIDTAGNTYVTGQTSAVNFPTRSARQAALGGNLDAFVMKLDPTGTQVLFSTYIGGSANDEGHSIALDASGNIIVAGFTFSQNFPAANAAQAARGGDQDAYVLKLNNSGSALIYSTYLGGTADDRAYGVAVDTGGNAYVTGATGSNNFPTVNGYQKSNAGGLDDVFVTKLNPAGSIVYSTYAGGRGHDLPYSIAVDGSGSAYVTGFTTSTNFPQVNAIQKAFGFGSDDAFLLKLNAAGDSLVFSTFFGGTGSDQAVRVALDADANPVITGTTTSLDLPVINALDPLPFGGFDIFVIKVKSDGSEAFFSTYLGGLGNESGAGLALDKDGNVYITGFTTSFDFPVVNAIQSSLQGERDAFIVKLSADGRVFLYSTYFGGSALEGGLGIAVDSGGNAYITGYSTSTDFPTTNPFQAENAGGQDGFIAKLDASDIVTSSKFNVTSQGGASFLSGGRGATSSALFGYATAEPATGNAQLTGLEILEFRRGQVTSNQVGFPAPPLRQGGRLFVEVTGSVRSVVSIANPTDEDISVDFFFTKSDGETPSFWTQTIPALNHFSRFVSDAPFNLTPDTSGTLNYNASVPVAATAFRTFTNERGDFIISATPIADIEHFTMEPQVIPQFADGANWDTQVVLVNTTENQMNGEVHFLDQTGNPIDVGVGTESTSVLEYDVPPRSFHRLSTSGIPLRSDIPFSATGGFSYKTAGTLTSGASGYVSAAAGSDITGLEIVEYRQSNITVSQAGVTAPALRRTGRVFVEGASLIKTLINIANPNDEDANVDVFFTSQDGASSNFVTIPVAAHARVSNFAGDVPINIPAESAGTLSFTSSAPVAVTVLRHVTNERGELLVSSAPIANIEQVSNTPVVIPHFADGAGWKTQVILVNPTENEITGELRFVNPAGSVTSVVSYDIAPRSFHRIDTDAAAANVNVGSIYVVPSEGLFTPQAHALVSLRDSEAALFEAPIEGQLPGSGFRLYAEALGNFDLGKAGSTQTAIALANPSSTPATVRLTLTKLDGTPFGGSGAIQIPPSGQVAMFLNQVPGFENFKSPIQGILQVNTVSGSGVTAAGLRTMFNERGSFLATTTGPLGDNGGSPRLIFPFVNDGGGYVSQIVLTGDTPGQGVSGVLRFLSQDGAALTIDELRVGSIHIVPFPETYTPHAHAIVSNHHLDATTFQTAIEGQQPARNFRFYVEESGNFEGNEAGSVRSSIAFANPTNTRADLRIELLKLDGTDTGRSATVSIPPNGQYSTFVHQLPGFDGLAAYKGLLRVTALNAGVTAVGLRALINERVELLETTTGPIIENAGSPERLVFPHIAEGGGFTTQFIILTGLAGQSSTGVLRFVDEQGRPLNLTLR